MDQKLLVFYFLVNRFYQFSCCREFQVTLPSERHAEIIYNSLSVDKEASRTKVRKKFHRRGKVFFMYVTSRDQIHKL